MLHFLSKEGTLLFYNTACTAAWLADVLLLTLELSKLLIEIKCNVPFFV